MPQTYPPSNGRRSTIQLARAYSVALILGGICELLHLIFPPYLSITQITHQPISFTIGLLLGIPAAFCVRDYLSEASR